MENSMQLTPKADRIHIGFFGKRNAGKSSLVNAIAQQAVSVVSDVPGTTTDVVEKAIELFPLGPVVLVDTPGMDDDAGELGAMRVQQAELAMERCDIAFVLVDSHTGKTDFEEQVLQLLTEKKIPHRLLWSKVDSVENFVESDWVNHTEKGVEHFHQILLGMLKQGSTPQPSKQVFTDLELQKDDLVLLVAPIDASAPKGRLILPQVQSIREVLDHHAVSIVVQPQQLETVLCSLKKSPRFLVTDSQALEQVFAVMDRLQLAIPITTFSIVMARLKGSLQMAMERVKHLEALQEGSRILISEGCSHQVQCGDIGRELIPRKIEAYTGKHFQFENTAGRDFPTDVSGYAMVIHCGGCMLNTKEVQRRAGIAMKQGIPFINYGVLLSYVLGGAVKEGSIFLERKKLGLS